MLAANTTLQNRYRIVRELGRGGMSAVYEAVDDRLGCLVALKEFMLDHSPSAVAAFRGEAKLLASLRHRTLTKVMDYFEETGRLFLVMEFIPGDDLHELLKRRNAPFPEELVFSWTKELLKLLVYLHGQTPPVLHLDIKPSNLKVTNDDELFLLDFGLAAGARGQTITETDTQSSSVSSDLSFRGYSPAYSPAEQIDGYQTDPRSDLYALGATMYHLLTAECPAMARERVAAFATGQTDPLRPISELNPNISPAFASAIHSAMSLWNRDRPENAAALLRMLDEGRLEQRIAIAGPTHSATERTLERIELRRQSDDRFTTTVPTEVEAESRQPIYADPNVQFTVYSPKRIKPEKPYQLLAFAHLSKRPEDAPQDEPDPVEVVKQQAAQILGERRHEFRDVKEASLYAIPRGGEVTFVPAIEGVTFIPPSKCFTWRKKVHREEFDMLASDEVEGRTLTGKLTVFLGSIIIAEVGLSLAVDRRAEATDAQTFDQPQTAWRLRQIFASYSHKDTEIVNELAHLAPIFGAQYLIDRTHLLPGEDWSSGLRRLIKGADVFQLFWSSNAMRSIEVGKEIDFALGLRRQNFILPTYWEEPMPRSRQEGLPPEALERLHFYRIYPGILSRLSDQRRSDQGSKFSTLEAKSSEEESKFTTQGRAPAPSGAILSADPRSAPQSMKGPPLFLLGCGALFALIAALIFYYFFALQ